MGYLFCLPSCACIFVLRVVGYWVWDICFACHLVHAYLFCVLSGTGYGIFVLLAILCMHICFACCRVLGTRYLFFLPSCACIFVLRVVGYWVRDICFSCPR